MRSCDILRYMKRCARCLNEFPEHEVITRQRKTKDYSVCRPCHTQKMRKYRRTSNGGENTRKAARASYRRHRAKQIARVKLRRALLAGKLRKSACYCGSTEVEAHHSDYSKPLVVLWVCRPHHSDLERTLK